MKSWVRFLPLVVLLSGAVAVGGTAHADDQPNYEPNKGSLDTHPLPQWWSDDKFGIFIHWGPYSVPAWAPPDPPSAKLGELVGINGNLYSEWYWFWQQFPGLGFYEHHAATYGITDDVQYDSFIKQWNPDKFDPAAWVDLFKRAGAKYFVLTTKHHDGVALWDTDTTNRDIVALGPHRDLVSELMAAADGSGLRKGVYYSIPEWFSPAPTPVTTFPPDQAYYDLAFNTLTAHNPYTDPFPVSAIDNLQARLTKKPLLALTYTGYTPIADYATGQVVPQIHELVDRFHPDILWCDIGGKESYFRSNATIADFYNAAAATNPDGVVVDDRCGDKTTHHDYTTVEYTPTVPPPPFEVTRGMGRSFAYNQAETAENYLSTTELVHTLVNTVSDGGNLLLDIGPKADGTIPDLLVERLEGIGQWLGINGEAIYGSRKCNNPILSGLRCTMGANGATYLTAESWPGQTLTVALPQGFKAGDEVVLLGSDGQPLPYTQNGSTLNVTLPAAPPAGTDAAAFVFRFAPPGTVLAAAPGAPTDRGTAAAGSAGDDRVAALQAGRAAELPTTGGAEPVVLIGALFAVALAARALGRARRS